MRVKDEMTQNAIGVAPRAKLRLAHDIALEAAEPQIMLSPDAASVAISVKATVTAMIWLRPLPAFRNDRSSITLQSAGLRPPPLS